MNAHDVDPDLVLEFCARKGCSYPGVLLFFDWLDPITAFSLEELGQLLNAMFEYARYGSIPVFEDRALLICWAHIQPRLDQDRYNWAWKIVSSYYANYCKDAKKAGEPLACFEVWFKREIDALSGPAADRPEPDGIRTQSGAAQRVPDDTQPTNTIPTPVTIPAATPAPACSEERDRAAEFAVLWDRYPRHDAKTLAEKAYDAVSAPLETLLRAIEQQIQSDQWQRDNGRFIPQLATWLSQERWSDTLARSGAGYQRHDAPLSPEMLDAVQRMLAEPDEQDNPDEQGVPDALF